MGLKVLLADESTSIKKAFQLALSDFGVEIKNVPSGLEVLEVALDFKPDIIFADVLLTQKSGYEVCRQIKSHSELSNTPVILMWSSFMQFDSELAIDAHYTDRLEKPFDTDDLRKKIEMYVKKTETHPLKNILKIPSVAQHMPEIDDSFSEFSHQSLRDIPESDSLQTNLFQSEAPSGSTTIELETESYGDFEEVVLVKPKQKSTQQTKRSQQHDEYTEKLIREEARILAEKICMQLIPEITERIVSEEIKKLMNQIEETSV